MPVPARVRALAHQIVDDAVAEASASTGAPVARPSCDVPAWADGATTREAVIGRVLLRAAMAAEDLTVRHGGRAPVATAPPPPVAEPQAVPEAPPPVADPPPVLGPVPLLVEAAESEAEPAIDPARLRAARIATWVRNVGAVLLLFVIYQVWGTGFEEARAQAKLKRHATAATAKPLPAAPSAPPAPLPGGSVAHLQIPSIGIDQYVVEGTDTADLRKGPGHYTGSPLPGQPGNAAVAGHRTTYGAPFNRLDELKIGDKIVTTTSKGATTYVVAQPPFPVTPRNIAVLNDYGDDRLTLTTCHPKYSASQRLVVVAKPDHPLVVAAAPRPAARPRVKVHDRTTWRIGSLPLAAFWGACLVALGLAYQQFRRRWPPLVTAVVLTPAWMCGLLLLFEQLNRFLPPNV